MYNETLVACLKQEIARLEVELADARDEITRLKSALPERSDKEIGPLDVACVTCRNRSENGMCLSFNINVCDGDFCMKHKPNVLKSKGDR